MTGKYFIAPATVATGYEILKTKKLD